MKLRITISGNTYEADVEVLEEEEGPAPPEPVPVYGAASSYAPAADAEAVEPVDRVCRSPVTGLVIRVHVEPGESVEAGQLLLVLEAMKMETQVTAPCAATVQQVHVTPGNSVKTNQVLVELD